MRMIANKENYFNVGNDLKDTIEFGSSEIKTC